MPKKNEKDTAPGINLARGFDGVFSGLGNLLRIAADLAEKSDGPIEVTREQSIGVPEGLKAGYGVSVRVGPAHRSVPRRFGRAYASAAAAPARTREEDIREPQTDVFDEGDCLLVVAELPGMSAGQIRWDVQSNLVAIKAEYKNRKYFKLVSLTSAVNAESVAATYNNGILELKLWKTI